MLTFKGTNRIIRSTMYPFLTNSKTIFINLSELAISTNIGKYFKLNVEGTNIQCKHKLVFS
jgi:hypothetical protein